MFNKRERENLLIGIVVLVLIIGVAANSSVRDVVLNQKSVGFGILDNDCAVDLDGNGIGDGCDPNLVLWLKMDDASSAVDSSLYGNDGVVDRVELVDGVVGHGFICAYPEGAEIPHAEHLNFGTGSFTVSVWVKYGGDKIGHFVRKYEARRKGWTLSHDTSKGVYVFVGDANDFYGPKKQMDYDGWQHLLYVFDTETEALRFYFDGEFIYERSLSEDLPYSSYFDNSEPIVLCDNMRLLSLDELRVYNRALTPSEIRNLASV